MRVVVWSTPLESYGRARFVLWDGTPGLFESRAIATIRNREDLNNEQ
jgi:hypothetical protein